MALPATADFNSAENPLVTNWTTAPGCYNMRAAANACLAAASVPAGCYWDADSFDNDQYSQCKAVNPTNDWGGPAVRIATGGATINLYVCAIRTYSILRVYKVVAGSYTQLGSDISITTIDATDVVKLEVSGTTLEVFVNDVSQDTRTDSAHSSGSAGIYNGTSQWMDDWEGGNLGVGGASKPHWYYEQMRKAV